MVFSEPTFLLLFLPLLLAAHFVVRGRMRNLVLLGASLVFYAWDERLWVLVMLSSITFNYVLGRLVDQRRDHPHARWLLAFAVGGNLTALIVFKYANFLAENADIVLVGMGLPTIDLPPVHLPIGISFFTFQALSYVVDVHRRDAPVQRNPLDVALYISLFPQLIAGPIVRYGEIADQIRDRTIDVQKFAEGVDRFVIGLAKKMMIANPAGARADAIFGLAATDLSAPIAWLGVVCYSVQIYFDFSGYSDMAIGLGKMFGFEFAENFNYPYVARSVTEFWRRWHISLSTWFRDYLYIPLGGSRGSLRRTYANLLIVFVLCGFWHGASWNFLIWGLFHGGLLVVERVGLGSVLRRAPSWVRHGYVVLAAMIAWVFFRAETLTDSLSFLAAMVGAVDTANNAQPLAYFVDTEIILVLLVGSVGSAPLLPALRGQLRSRLPSVACDVIGVATLSVLLLGCITLMAAGSYNPFIYFRF